MATCLSSSPFLRLTASPFKGNFDRLWPSGSSLFSFYGARVQSLSSFSPVKPLIRCRAASISELEAASSTSPARFRLNNLGPQPGSRKRSKRKGRGIAAGQGNSCGFGMRGQKSRSGPGVRKGFEGGQMPLYRRIPKLRGIAGGMHAGLPKFVPVNLKDIEAAGFKEGDEVSLESLKKKGVINPSGRERSLPLKILADGDLSVKLSIKARSFSAAAREKLVSAGCNLTVLPGRKKWLKPSVVKNLARAEEYFAKRRATGTAAEVASVSN
ncbi:50S ribosomal protein L15, chloroplastic [Dendrobium catenatum]|uniref:50S ribosomal protein L15, chloroplastic n=1 Tax=Dendrobium catenatum TaxID=906689 RepID=A0A2I0WMJ5_9ASPA|nr:50S ribosomal protein L15, chloroplastic [Dendrobium catenatum]PKU76884.1 50S ribosomal protein L15, chloroplastic [Dendrobium catenatum]